MNLKITAIRDAGDLSKERVVMRALKAVDVGDYAILQTGFQNQELDTRIKNTYWFPNKHVQIGDYVIVYTKRGIDRDREFNEHISHFFYWGLSNSIWDTPDISAVLLESPNWQSFPAKNSNG